MIPEQIIENIPRKYADGTFTMLADDQIDFSILGRIGKAIAWIFAPLGFGNWQATVASITGLVAKENIVGTMGILYSAGEGTVYANMAATFTVVSGYAFLAFNLLCAPCFAAMGAIKREMNNTEDKVIRWRSGTIRYGASSIPSSNSWYSIKKHVGAWMVIHQEGRNNHHTFNNHYLVHNILRIC
jgi:Fe2+ transport system protein B